jgi:hypothetical protein
VGEAVHVAGGMLKLRRGRTDRLDDLGDRAFERAGERQQLVAAGTCVGAAFCLEALLALGLDLFQCDAGRFSACLADPADFNASASDCSLAVRASDCSTNSLPM